MYNYINTFVLIIHIHYASGMPQGRNTDQVKEVSSGSTGLWQKRLGNCVTQNGPHLFVPLKTADELNLVQLLQVFFTCIGPPSGKF